MGWFFVLAGVANFWMTLGNVTSDSTRLGAMAIAVSVGAFILPGLICAGVGMIRQQLPAPIAPPAEAGVEPHSAKA